MRQLREVQKSEFYVGQVVAHDIFLENKTLFLKGGSLINEKMKRRLDLMKEKLFTLDIEKFYKESSKKIRNIMEQVSTGDSINKIEIEELTRPFLNEISYNQGFVKVLTKLKNVDEYTFIHNINVSIFSMLLARWLSYSREEIKSIGEAGMLHDIGKSFIPLEILNKPGKLTVEEYDIMKKHSFYGYEYLIKNNFTQKICLGSLQHHEKINGGGYPKGLKGNEISEIGQIIAVADVYHAMISKRVYKNAVNPFSVLNYIKDLYQEYNPKYLIIFTENMLQSLVGIEVILSNGRKTEVLFINKSDIENPIVRYLDSEEIIDLSKEDSIFIECVDNSNIK